MNPYLLDLTGNSDITINKLKANYLGNISVPLSSLPDVNIIDESLASGEVLCYNGTQWSNIQQHHLLILFQYFNHFLKKDKHLVIVV